MNPLLLSGLQRKRDGKEKAATMRRGKHRASGRGILLDPVSGEQQDVGSALKHVPPPAAATTTSPSHRLLSRLGKLNCAAATSRLHENMDDFDMKGNHSFSSITADCADIAVEDEFDVQDKPLPPVRATRKSWMTVQPSPCPLPTLQEVDSDAVLESEEQQIEQEEGSDAYFTDDDSSTSSGLQVDTMQADSSYSSGDVECYDDDSADAEVASLGGGDSEGRIGIRPFLLPIVPPDASVNDEDNDDCSSVLSPPVFSMSNSSFAVNEETKADDSKPKADVWIHFYSHSAPESSQPSEELAHRQEEGKLDNFDQDEPLGECEYQNHMILAPLVHADEGLRETLLDNMQHHHSQYVSDNVAINAITEPASPSSTTNSMLVEPPTLDRHLTSYRETGNNAQDSDATFRRGILRKKRLYGSEESIDEQLQQMPLLFHPEARSLQLFRTSSPGNEPAPQQSRVAFCLPLPEKEEHEMTPSAARLRPRSPPASASDMAHLPRNVSVLARVQALNSRSTGHGPPYFGGTDARPSITWKAARPMGAVTLPVSRSCANAFKESNNDSVGTRQKVRWSSELSSAVDVVPVPQLPSRSDVQAGHPSRPDHAKESLEEPSCTLSCGDQTRLETQADVNPGLPVIVTNNVLCATAIVPKTDDELANEMHLEREEIYRFTKSRIHCSRSIAVETGSVASGQTSESFSSIKDLINKFDSQTTLSSNRNPRQNRGRALKVEANTSVFVDVLARQSNETFDRSSIAKTSSAVHDVQRNGRSGFFWRSHPSELLSPPGGRPVAEEKHDAETSTPKVERVVCSDCSTDADGMTAETDTTHDNTTTDDDTYRVDLESYWA